MKLSIDELKTTLSRLPMHDRAELARYLFHTLDQPEEGAAAEWRALADQRMNDIRAGNVEGVHAEQVWQPVEELNQ
jgi:putative addiction module component (TIGR02574 family)